MLGRFVCWVWLDRTVGWLYRPGKVGLGVGQRRFIK